MPSWMTCGPFRPDVPGDFAPLRRVLADAGFDREMLFRLGAIGTDRKVGASRLLHETRANPRLQAISRLLLMSERMSEELAAAALDPFPIAALVDSGFLVREGGRVRVTACMLPMDGRLTLRDFDPWENGEPLTPDHVASVSLSTGMVATMTVREPSGRALDLGCGSGFHALLAAEHCREVVATDINDRALNFAAMTMRINGVPNVELRKGSLFEPVAGEQFDLIVSNPPFVISPSTELIFRDSGLPGDQVCERILRRIPSMLNDGGWATVLFNWHHKDDETWGDRPAEWLRGAGCDVWLNKLRTDDPESYARVWISVGKGLGEPEAHEVAPWLAYYKSIGAEAMSLAAVVLHKRDSAGVANWTRVDEPKAQDRMTPASAQIKRVFAAETALRTDRGELAVGELRLRLTPGAILEGASVPEKGAWRTKSSHLVLSDGFGQRLPVDPMVATAVGRCDGTRMFAEVLGELAREHGADPSQWAGASRVMATLLRAGFFEIV